MIAARDAYEERAAIREHDGKLPRATAEAEAWAELPAAIQLLFTEAEQPW